MIDIVSIQLCRHDADVGDTRLRAITGPCQVWKAQNGQISNNNNHNFIYTLEPEAKLCSGQLGLQYM